MADDLASIKQIWQTLQTVYCGHTWIEPRFLEHAMHTTGGRLDALLLSVGLSVGRLLQSCSADAQERLIEQLAIEVNFVAQGWASRQLVRASSSDAVCYAHAAAGSYVIKVNKRPISKPNSIRHSDFPQ